MAERRRRGHGEGSIYRLPNGRWQGSVDLGWKDGKRMRRRVTRATRRDVAEALTSLRTAARPAEPTMTVRAWIRTYLDEVASTRVRPRTLHGYRDQFTRYVEPTVGDVLLPDLSPQHLQRLYLSLSKRLSPASVRRVHALLRRALGIAVRWDLIGRNPADMVDPPSLQQREIEPYSVEEAQRFLAEASEERLFARWIVALYFGLRQGEALGLRWQDLDLDIGVLSVRQAVQAMPGGVLAFTELKTKRSRRDLPVPPAVADALRARKLACESERAAAGPLWENHDLIACTHTGRPLHPRNDYRSFRQIASRAGLRRVRLHDLRHTTATLLLAAGVAPRVVMEILGHSQIAVTMDVYTHVDTSLSAAALDRLHALLAEQT